MIRTEMLRATTLADAVASSRLLAPVFFLLLLAAATPIFIDPIPPLADYINHLGRMHVIAALDGDHLLGRFYEIDWAIIPNLVMDLLVPTLNRVFDVYLSGQIFIFATIVVMVTGPMAIQKALFGRLSPWPLLAFPFVYNGIFLFGFMNYLFGLGVAMWGMAGWIALRDRSALTRGLFSSVVVLALFICHLFALGLYGLGLLALEGWLFARRQPRRPLDLVGDALAFGLPFAPVIPLMLASPTLGLSNENIWESDGKLDGLLFVVQAYSDTFDLCVGGLVVAYTVWMARRRLISLHPAGLALLGLGTAVFLAMPRMLFGSWVADQRLPVAIVFMVLGFVRFHTHDRANRYAFYAFVIGLSLVRYVDIQAHWRGLEAVSHDVRATMGLIAPGATVLVAHVDQPSGPDSANQALAHAPCMAMIERAALVSTAFSVPGKQVLSIRPDYRDRVDTNDGDPPTVSQLVATAEGSVPGMERYWDGWASRYDYVYILYTEDEPNPDPEHLTLIHQGPRFQLYQVLRPTPDDGAE